MYDDGVSIELLEAQVHPGYIQHTSSLIQCFSTVVSILQVYWTGFCEEFAFQEVVS